MTIHVKRIHMPTAFDTVQCHVLKKNCDNLLSFSCKIYWKLLEHDHIFVTAFLPVNEQQNFSLLGNCSLNFLKSFIFHKDEIFFVYLDLIFHYQIFDSNI